MLPLFSTQSFISFTLYSFYGSFQPVFYVRPPELLSLSVPEKDIDTVTVLPKERKKNFLLIKFLWHFYIKFKILVISTATSNWRQGKAFLRSFATEDRPVLLVKAPVILWFMFLFFLKEVAVQTWQALNVVVDTNKKLKILVNLYNLK